MDLKRLGNTQKETIRKMLNGFYITYLADYSHEISIRDSYRLTNGADDLYLSYPVTPSLYKRGLLTEQMVYRTLQTDHYEYRLKPELIAELKKTFL